MCGPAGMMMGQKPKQVSFNPPADRIGEDPNLPSKPPEGRPITDQGPLMGLGLPRY